MLGSNCHNLNFTSTSDGFYRPTIEDRLENTEKLIREMNAKFEDITSSKFSAKHEFSKLVHTLTKNQLSNIVHIESDSESNSDGDLSQSDDYCSGNSSMDEEA